MTDEVAFQEKFGCTKEEYADKMAIRMQALLSKRLSPESQEVALERALEQAHRIVEAQFKKYVDEGVVTDWRIVVRASGEYQVRIVVPDEFVATFRNKGFYVDSAATSEGADPRDR